MDHVNVSGDIGAMDVNRGVGVQPQAHVDTDIVLETLLRNATEEFGFAPRDVYNGVFDLPWMKYHIRKHNGHLFPCLCHLMSPFC